MTSFQKAGSELSRVPSHMRVLGSQPPGSQKVTAFGDGAFKEVMKVKQARGDRHPSRVEAKNPALLSSRDGYLLELTGWTKGSQAS